MKLKPQKSLASLILPCLLAFVAAASAQSLKHPPFGDTFQEAGETLKKFRAEKKQRDECSEEKIKEEKGDSIVVAARKGCAETVSALIAAAAKEGLLPRLKQAQKAAQEKRDALGVELALTQQRYDNQNGKLRTQPPHANDSDMYAGRVFVQLGSDLNHIKSTIKKFDDTLQALKKAIGNLPNQGPHGPGGGGKP